MCRVRPYPLECAGWSQREHLPVRVAGATNTAQTVSTVGIGGLVQGRAVAAAVHATAWLTRIDDIDRSGHQSALQVVSTDLHETILALIALLCLAVTWGFPQFRLVTAAQDAAAKARATPLVLGGFSDQRPSGRPAPISPASPPGKGRPPFSRRSNSATAANSTPVAQSEKLACSARTEDRVNAARIRRPSPSGTYNEMRPLVTPELGRTPVDRSVAATAGPFPLDPNSTNSANTTGFPGCGGPLLVARPWGCRAVGPECKGGVSLAWSGSAAHK